MRFVERAILAAPPEAVWDVLTDWDRQAAWMPDVVWVRPLGGRRENGAVLRARTRVFGIPAVTDTLVVTGWHPPERLTVAHAGLVRGAGEWRLVPADERATEFTWTEIIRLPPPLLGEAVLAFYAPWQRLMMQRSVRNLGGMLASEAAPSG